MTVIAAALIILIASIDILAAEEKLLKNLVTTARVANESEELWISNQLVTAEGDLAMTSFNLREELLSPTMAYADNVVAEVGSNNVGHAENSTENVFKMLPKVLTSSAEDVHPNTSDLDNIVLSDKTHRQEANKGHLEFNPSLDSIVTDGTEDNASQSNISLNDFLPKPMPDKIKDYAYNSAKLSGQQNLKTNEEYENKDQTLNLCDSVLLRIILKDTPASTNATNGNEKSIEHLNIVKQSKISDVLTNELSLQSAFQVSEELDKSPDFSYNSTKFVTQADNTIIADHGIHTKVNNGLYISRKTNISDTAYDNSSILPKQELENQSSSYNSTIFYTERMPKILNEFNTGSQSLNSPEQLQNTNLSESELVDIILKDVANVTKKADNSLEPSLEVATTTDAATEVTPKSPIGLEEYAVKQMNFILDHLLLETQAFVTKVLQASIMSVFPRDNLKRYAEALNRILNRDHTDNDSDELIAPTKASNTDEIYEETVKKLNFLKGQSNKYLEKDIPREWINDFFSKKSELTIWLDKAAEQMHKEFNDYISEAEDHIKYQYFMETFDDISRATEINHKLTFLADLVKIVKNKKQITFTDLYMQT